MSDVLIIGGGIIGLTTALELQQHGLTVTLLEKSQIGAGASGAAGGILSPLRPWQNETAVTQLCTLSLSCYHKLVNDLQAQDESITLTQSGLLYLIPDEIHTACTWAQAHDWECSALNASALAQEEPAIKAVDGFLFPQVFQVEPLSLVGALARVAKRRGIDIRENCSAHTIPLEKSRVSGANTNHGLIHAETVVVCAGAWMTSLLPATLSCPEIQPVRGQMIEFTATPQLLHHMVLSKVASEISELEMDYYLIPRPDGRILVGSTLEHCGFDDSITDTARAELSIFAKQLLPALKQYPITRQWAGLRPDAASTTPFICAHPEIDNLFINGGHYRNGIVLAPASALLITQLICRETPHIDMKPFEMNP